MRHLTGWRHGEICSLEWADVEGDVIRLQPENAKKVPCQVKLNGELAELIWNCHRRTRSEVVG